MDVGKRIKERRKALGLSAEEVAAEIGVSPATVYRYESAAIMNMRTDKLVPIAVALSTTPAYLMGWEDDPVDYDEDDLSDVRCELVDYFDGDAKRIREFLEVQDEVALKEQLFSDPVTQEPWYTPLLAAYVAAPIPTQKNVCKLLDCAHVHPMPAAPSLHARDEITRDQLRASIIPNKEAK